MAPDAEITSEANPGTVDQAHFAALRAMGVNRLSMGVQSFDDAELRWLGRIHSADEAEAAFAAARRGRLRQHQPRLHVRPARPDPPRGRAPWHGRSAWRRSISRSTASPWSMAPRWPTRCAAAWPPSRTTTWPPTCTIAGEMLAAGGYEQYEISNWAEATGVRNQESGVRTPFAHSPFVIPASFQPSCHHNLVYWRREPYLGFGAGAHSFDGSSAVVECQASAGVHPPDRGRAGRRKREARRSTAGWRWARR